MDVVSLGRLQFAVTAVFHFIFVPLTLGLSVLVALMQTWHLRTGDESYLRMAKFWGKLFLINFALGVVTGITMEFQFGMNWAEYSKYVGDVFGAPLAIEATVAFFLESTFIGVWIFGWDRLPKKLHAASIWLVALGTNLSALWIILANGWMQHPVGYVLRNGRAEMVDFWALFSNPYGWVQFLHSIAAGWTVGAFFVMGVSAWHLLRGSQPEIFRPSFKMGAAFGLAASLAAAAAGDLSGVTVAKYQPAKFAAMESVWETQARAPYTLLVVPDPANERNRVEALKVPLALSLMAYHDPDGVVKGLKDFPKEDRPPVWPVFLTFRAMVGLGFLFLGLSALALYLSHKDLLERFPLLLKALVWTIPLPYIANHLGWMTAEIGRQPWIVYGLMRTSEGVSKGVSAGQVWASLAGFGLLYGALGAIDIWLLFKYSRAGAPAPAKG